MATRAGLTRFAVVNPNFSPKSLVRNFCSEKMEWVSVEELENEKKSHNEKKKSRPNGYIYLMEFSAVRKGLELSCTFLGKGGGKMIVQSSSKRVIETFNQFNM